MTIDYSREQIYNSIIKRGKEGKANGKENKRAEKSGISTYPAHTRNWNLNSHNKNGY